MGDIESTAQVLLTTLNDLAIIDDYEVALDQIEVFADTIDSVCDTILATHDPHKDENNAAIGRLLLDNDVISKFLKMLSSPCEEVVKLTLSGFDRIVPHVDISVLVVKSGGLPTIAQIFTQAPLTGDGYLKIKASDVIAYLITSNDFIKPIILNGDVYSEHVKMMTSGKEEFVERAAQFLWCLTNSFEDAQIKVSANRDVVDKLLRTVADSDIGRNSLRVLLNMVRSDQARDSLPKKELSSLAKTILKIPDEHIDERDKTIAALIYAYLLEDDVEVESSLVARFSDMLFDTLHGRSNQTLSDVLHGIENFTKNTSNRRKLLVTTTSSLPIVKCLFDILSMEAKLAAKKGVHNLDSVKLLASKILRTLTGDKLVIRAHFMNDDSLEILRILQDSVDDELADNISKILKNIEANKREEEANEPKLARSSSIPISSNYYFVVGSEGELKPQFDASPKLKSSLDGIPLDDEDVGTDLDDALHRSEIGSAAASEDRVVDKIEITPHFESEEVTTNLKLIRSTDSIIMSDSDKVDEEIIHRPEASDKAFATNIDDDESRVGGLVDGIISNVMHKVEERVDQKLREEITVVASQSGNTQIHNTDPHNYRKEDIDDVAENGTKNGSHRNNDEAPHRNDEASHRNDEASHRNDEASHRNDETPPRRNDDEAPRHNDEAAPPRNVKERGVRSSKKLDVWKSSDVALWLADIGLGIYTNIFTSNRVNGRALMEMARRVDDVKFVKLVEQKLQIDFFGDLMVLLDELRKFQTEIK